MTREFCEWLLFVMEVAAIKDHKLAVGAVQGKVRTLATCVRFSDHWGAALWAKHSGPPVFRTDSVKDLFTFYMSQ